MSIFPIAFVPHGFFRVQDRMGILTGFKLPGVHVTTPFLEGFVHVDWSFEGKTSSRVYGVDIPSTTLLFDPPSVKCPTRDGFYVHVDLAIEFHVFPSTKCVEKNKGNVFASIEIMVRAKLFESIRRIDLANLDPEEVQRSVFSGTEQLFEDYGAVLEDVLVESIKIPDSIATAKQDSEAMRRVQEASMIAMEQKAAKELKQVELKKSLRAAVRDEESADAAHEVKKRRLFLEADEEEHASKMKRERAELDVKLNHRREMLGLLGKAGLSEAVVLQVLHSDSMQHIGTNASKTVFAPTDALSNMRVHVDK